MAADAKTVVVGRAQERIRNQLGVTARSHESGDFEQQVLLNCITITRASSRGYLRRVVPAAITSSRSETTSTTAINIHSEGRFARRENTGGRAHDLSGRVIKKLEISVERYSAPCRPKDRRVARTKPLPDDVYRHSRHACRKSELR